ncbi:MAG: polysaccharide biosynthesis C-terminal domain-containing protein [Planctomycetota bacterium]
MSDTPASDPGESKGAAANEPVSIRRFIGETAVFGLVDAFGKFLGFVLLPITAALLTPADFGILGLFGTTSSIVFIFCSLGLPTTFFRFYSEASDEPSRRKIIGTAIWSLTAYSAVTLSALLIFGHSLNQFLFQSNSALFVLAILAYLSCFDSLGTCKLQADGKAWTFFWISITGILVHRGLGLYLIFQNWGAWGWIYAEVLSMFIMFLLMLGLTFRNLRFTYSVDAAHEMLPYGATLVPVFISSWVMAGCDKYMIRLLMDDPFAQIGFYSFGENQFDHATMIIQAFSLGWRRYAFQNMHHEEGPRLLGKGISFFVLTTAYAAMGLALLGDDLIHWAISADYRPGSVVIPSLTLASLFWGWGEIAGIGFHKAKRTINLAGYNVLAAFLNVALNFVAIPLFGILGAATATFLCQATKTFLIWRKAQRAFFIPLDYPRLAGVGGVLIAVYAIAFTLGRVAIARLPDPYGWLTASSVETVLSLLVLPLLWFSGILRPEEKTLIVTWVSKAMNRVRGR